MPIFEVPSSNRPQSAPGLSRLPLQRPELRHHSKRELSVGKAVALADDLGIQEQVLGLQIDVGKRSTVAIYPVLIEFQAYPSAGCQLPGKVRGFPAKVLDGASRIDCFRRVHADESDGAHLLHDNSVAVDDASHQWEGRRACNRRRTSR